MIRMRTIITEILLERLPADIFKHKIINPRKDETGREMISIGWALQQPRNSEAYIQARQYMMKFLGRGSRTQDIGISATTPVDQDQQVEPRDDANVPRQAHVKNPLTSDELEEFGKLLEGGLEFNVEAPIGSLIKITSTSEFTSNRDVMDRELESGTSVSSDDLVRAALGLAKGSNTKSIRIYVDSLRKRPSWDRTPDNDLVYNPDAASAEIGITYQTDSGFGESKFIFPSEGEPYLYAPLIRMDSSGGSQSGSLRPNSPAIIKTAIDMCDAVGVTKIKFNAALESGGYIWAKMGGYPTGSPAALEVLRNGVTQRQQSIREYIQSKHDGGRTESPIDSFKRHSYLLPDKVISGAMRKIDMYRQQGTLDVNMKLIDSAIASIGDDPRALSILANHELGRYFLQGTNWDGEFDITAGSESRSVIEGQISR